MCSRCALCIPLLCSLLPSKALVRLPKRRSMASHASEEHRRICLQPKCLSFRQWRMFPYVISRSRSRQVLSQSTTGRRTPEPARLDDRDKRLPRTLDAKRTSTTGCTRECSDLDGPFRDSEVVWCDGARCEEFRVSLYEAYSPPHCRDTFVCPWGDRGKTLAISRSVLGGIFRMQGFVCIVGTCGRRESTTTIASAF